MLPPPELKAKRPSETGEYVVLCWVTAESVPSVFTVTNSQSPSMTWPAASRWPSGEKLT
jgi:hypothetical protein